MSFVKIIEPVIYGTILFFILGWIGYIFYWILKKTYLLKFIKKKLFKKKVSNEVYVYVAQHLQQGKEFDDLAQYISKFPKPIQDQYIQAYLEIKELKGGV